MPAPEIHTRRLAAIGSLMRSAQPAAMACLVREYLRELAR